MSIVPASSMRTRAAQVLSVLLALVVGLQGLPLQSVLHVVHDAPPHQECTHPEGFCPMSPNGPCECDHDRDHSTPERPDAPTLRSCDGGPSDGIFSSTPGMWFSRSIDRMPLPRESSSPRATALSFLSSQRAADDIFRPPRPRSGDRSGVALPALLHT